jgi:hypothetical protein
LNQDGGIEKDGQDDAVLSWIPFHHPGYLDSKGSFFESGWPGLKRMARMMPCYPEYPSIILAILIRMAHCLNLDGRDENGWSGWFSGI